MIRWLKIARAELIRDIKMSLRYPLELGTGVFILYAMFMAIYMGSQMIAGPWAQTSASAGLDSVVIRFVMWFFALMAINTVSVDIEMEARAGTLEQVIINAPSYLGLVWTRAATHLTLGAGAVVALAVLIQATTGNWLRISPAGLLPMLLIIVLTVAQLCGFGLILGGLTLVLKRVNQFSALVQFSLFFIAYMDLSRLAEPAATLVAHLPLARGVDLLNALLVETATVRDLETGLAWLLLDTTVYVLIGSLTFLGMERVARKNGLLSHY